MEKFNFKRFWMVFRRESYDMIPIFAIIGAVFGIYLSSSMSITFFQFLSRLDGNEVQFGVLEPREKMPFIMTLFFSGPHFVAFLLLIVTSFMFNFAANKRTLIPDIIMPATAKEKFCSKMLIFWVIPAIAAFIFTHISHYTISHFEQIGANGETFSMVTINGILTITESSLPSFTEINGWLYCLYLCLSGVLIFAGSFFRKKTMLKTLAVISGLIVLLLVVLVITFNNQYIDLSDYNCFLLDFIRWIRQTSFRVLAFQLLFGWFVVAVCAYFAYRRYARFTLK